jgi:predicted aspartyl protease
MITNIMVVAMLTQFAFMSTDSVEPHIGFSFVRESLVVIPVVLNGHGAYRFLLDTGATHTVLSRAVANQLHVPAGKPQTLITAGGTVPVTLRTLETVQIGNVRMTQVPIAVADFELLHTLNIDGIIGADYLRQFKISIDYAHRLLTIGQ